jgi:hypothetical protein
MLDKRNEGNEENEENEENEGKNFLKKVFPLTPFSKTLRNKGKGKCQSYLS